MADLEGEIEYLDEDAEIVQQCVGLPGISPNSIKVPEYFQLRPTRAKRSSVQKRRRDDDDSEYEPSDEPPPSPPSPPPTKKRLIKPIKQKQPRANFPSSPYLKISKYPYLYQPTVLEQFLKRKLMDIHIPDFDDPLCLPVRALKADDSDRKRLNNWNNVCLEHFKHCDTLLKPEEGHIKRSMRTAVFKNVINKQTGQTETTIWSKVCVENEESDKKSEIFQCVLPRYREKKGLPNFSCKPQQSQPSEKVVTEMILSKESHKDGEALVVYNPQDSVSAVYGLIDKRKKSEEESEPGSRTEEARLFLRELAACRVCAPCFQTSWRGVAHLKTKCAVCPVCARACVTAYNLLSHFKTHSATQLARYRRVISALLADIVGYHYRCRICRRKFDSIAALRGHVRTHQGKENFKCSVCNRMIN